MDLMKRNSKNKQQKGSTIRDDTVKERTERTVYSALLQKPTAKSVHTPHSTLYNALDSRVKAAHNMRGLSDKVIYLVTALRSSYRWVTYG